MKLLLVRHGETDWNLERRYQSYSDIQLNQAGIQQAQALARRLSKEKIDIIYSSDVSRAVETANYISREQEPVPAIRCDSRWRELAFGKWEGLNHTEIQAQWQTEVNAWYEDPVNISPPEGETMLQMSDRVRSALNEVQKKNEDETILIVSHGGTIQILLCILLGMALNRYWQFHVHQSSLTTIQFYKDASILNLFNDVSHLKDS